MRGVINENIIDVLNLRPLDEVLKEQGVDVHAELKPETKPIDQQQIDHSISKSVNVLHDLTQQMHMIEGTDHSESMDTLHDEVLTHARDLMTYGFNIDSPRARGIFEIAATMYGHAMTAKNSKRDAQLKAMKLALDRKRVHLEEKRTNHIIGQIDVNEEIVGVDRNELLRQIRQDKTNRIDHISDSTDPSDPRL